MGNHQVEIKKRLLWELVQKNSASAPTFFILGVLVFFYRFEVPEYQLVIQTCMALVILISVYRFFISRMAVKNKMNKVKAIKGIVIATGLNSLCWGIAFAFIFLQTPFNSPHYAGAFTLVCGLVTSSILTLSYVPALAIFFQLALLSSASYFAFAQYVQSSGQLPLFIGVLFVFYTLYLLKQTRDFYSQIYEKYNHEVNLELSIHQIKESNERILEETARSEQSSRLAALGEMAGGVAHEINNPLAIIAGNIELAEKIMQRDNINSPDLIKKIKGSLDGIRRITRIVNSLRSTARDERIGEQMQKKLAIELIEDPLNLCSEKFIANGIKLEVQDCPKLFVHSKPTLVSQIMINLLNNAYDVVMACPGETRKMKIIFKPERGFLNICLENSGPAMPKEIREKIFQPFFTTKEIGKGVGLGLSTSKQMVESMGGQIWLDQECQNTTICFSLPIAG